MKVDKINEVGNFLTFKQLVKLFSGVETEEDFYNATGEIGKSFENGKISWDDYQMLYNLSDKVGVGIGLNIHPLKRK